MLSVDKLISAAKGRTGINAFTDDSFFEGFEQLVASLNKDAKLDEDTESHVGQQLTRFLVNRLRMDRDITQHPEILEQEMPPPVLITSLPRTGSTKLHRMLAASGDFLGIQTWQEYNFAPFPDAKPGEPDPRIQEAYDYIAWFRSRAPSALQAHPMDAEAVEEELLLLAATMRSPFFHNANYDVPGFIEWVTQQDVRDTYRDLRRMLLYLQWQHYSGQNKPWVLKSPTHLGFEQAFDDVFPGTRFIVTHREPLEVIPSVCSLMCKMREVYSKDDISEQAGIWGKTVFPHLMNNHMAWCERNLQARVFNIGYEEINKHELAAIEKIYRFLEIPLNSVALGNLHQWQEKQGKDHFQPHKYSLEKFKLSENEIIEAFSNYYERYARYI